MLSRYILIAEDPQNNFLSSSGLITRYISTMGSESLRLSRLVAEIAVKGYNSYLQLDGSIDTPRLDHFNSVLPVISYNAFKSSCLRVDRITLLDCLHDIDCVHFTTTTTTTTRDATHSNSENRFRLAEYELIVPLLR